MGGFSNQNDTATLTVVFRDAALATLGTETLGPVTRTDRGDATGMLFRSTSVSVPAGTRSALVTLDFSTDIPTYNNGYADALSLVISL